MRNSLRAAFGAAAAASALVLGIAGCGDDTATTSTPSQSGSSAPDAASTTTQSAATSSAAEVGGPSNLPGPRSSYPADQSTSTVAGKDCGLSKGPDGALKVTIFEGSNVSCDDIKPVVDKYGPMISTGEDQTVDGWKCGLAQKTGVLAECTKGDNRFGFSPR